MKSFLSVVLAVILAAGFTGCDKKSETEFTNETSTENSVEEILIEEGNEDVTLPEEGIEETVQAVITMESGDTITLELYPDIAPITVANFKELCEEGFYDGLTFHRIISGFMIQGGDPLGNGTGGPGHTIKGEFSANGVVNNLKHTRGVISMARSQAYDSAGSQFFIMHEDAPHLDGQYAAFGKVIDGMDAVDTIANTAVYFDGQTPLEPVVIESIKIVE